MFDIKGDKILLNTDDLAIPAFKDYYNSAKDKSQALKMMEFIIWRYKWNTPQVFFAILYYIIIRMFGWLYHRYNN